MDELEKYLIEKLFTERVIGEWWRLLKSNIYLVEILDKGKNIAIRQTYHLDTTPIDNHLHPEIDPLVLLQALKEYEKIEGYN